MTPEKNIQVKRPANRETRAARIEINQRSDAQQLADDIQEYAQRKAVLDAMVASLAIFEKEIKERFEWLVAAGAPADALPTALQHFDTSAIEVVDLPTLTTILLRRKRYDLMKIGISQAEFKKAHLAGAIGKPYLGLYTYVPGTSVRWAGGALKAILEQMGG